MYIFGVLSLKNFYMLGKLMDKWQDVMFQIISQTIIFVRILVSPRAPRTSKRLNEKCAILKIELRTFENHYRHVNG